MLSTKAMYVVEFMRLLGLAVNTEIITVIGCSTLSRCSKHQVDAWTSEYLRPIYIGVLLQCKEGSITCFALLLWGPGTKLLFLSLSHFRGYVFLIQQQLVSLLNVTLHNTRPVS